MCLLSFVHLGKTQCKGCFIEIFSGELPNHWPTLHPETHTRHLYSTLLTAVTSLERLHRPLYPQQLPLSWRCSVLRPHGSTLIKSQLKNARTRWSYDTLSARHISVRQLTFECLLKQQIHVYVFGFQAHSPQISSHSDIVEWWAKHTKLPKGSLPVDAGVEVGPKEYATIHIYKHS